MALSLGLYLSPQGANAQNTPPSSLKDTLSDPMGGLTSLLFAQIRPANAPLKRNDPGAVVKEQLRTTLEEGGHFSVTTVSLTQPRINKAVKDHTLEPSDLEEPFRTESLQKIARVLGIRYILTFQTTLDKNTMTTEIRFLESAGVTEWRTVLSSQFVTPPNVGKRRLKPEEMALLNVDAIAASLNIPSHLSDSLHLELKPRNPLPPEKTQVAKNNKPTPPDKPIDSHPGETADPQSPLTNNNQGEEGTRISSDPKNGTLPGKNPGRTGPPSGKPTQPADPPTRATAKPAQPSNPTPQHGKPAPTISSDALNALNGNPNGGASATAVEMPDYEALAQRYRQVDDLANVIMALRHAINEKPRDLNLRRALIQTYQDRNMNDAAIAEIGRALILAPNDSSLYQLSGDALYAKGDVPGAIRAYKDATRINPNNTAAQVALGDALLSDLQFAEAMNAYQVAITNDAKSPLPHRRLARALASRAASDTTLYATSVEELKKARSLTPPSDAQSYLGDYVALMRLMESRLNDLLDEMEGTYSAFREGKRTRDEAIRSVDDLKRRATAASDYLDNVPAAVGHDITQAQYQQGAATVLEALSYFRSYLDTENDKRLDDKLRIARIDARHALAAAGKRLPTNTTPARSTGHESNNTP